MTVNASNTEYLTVPCTTIDDAALDDTIGRQSVLPPSEHRAFLQHDHAFVESRGETPQAPEYFQLGRT